MQHPRCTLLLGEFDHALQELFVVRFLVIVLDGLWSSRAQVMPSTGCEQDPTSHLAQGRPRIWPAPNVRLAKSFHQRLVVILRMLTTRWATAARQAHCQHLTGVLLEELLKDLDDVCKHEAEIKGAVADHQVVAIVLDSDVKSAHTCCQLLVQRQHLCLHEARAATEGHGVVRTRDEELRHRLVVRDPSHPRPCLLDIDVAAREVWGNLAPHGCDAGLRVVCGVPHLVEGRVLEVAERIHLPEGGCIGTCG
mmetsp:Transcript_36290/g.92448  ORF Transcript_36290/g.92448 Transcript_36290/m.92448 type:complete len:251 (+) Transcript_36290:288-1040(+)